MQIYYKKKITKNLKSDELEKQWELVESLKQDIKNYHLLIEESEELIAKLLVKIVDNKLERFQCKFDCIEPKNDFGDKRIWVEGYINDKYKLTDRICRVLDIKEEDFIFFEKLRKGSVFTFETYITKIDSNKKIIYIGKALNLKKGYLSSYDK